MKALFGGGEATLVEAVSLLLYPAHTYAGRTAKSQPAMPTSTTINVRVRDGFFLAEPEANLFVKLARTVRPAGSAIDSWTADGSLTITATTTV